MLFKQEEKREEKRENEREKMKVLELSKDYCKKFYNGNFEKMIEEEDGVIYDNETIKSAFKLGNGTEKDLKRYMEDNKVFCKYYDLINKKYIY